MLWECGEELKLLVVVLKVPTVAAPAAGTIIAIHIATASAGFNADVGRRRKHQ